MILKEEASDVFKNFPTDVNAEYTFARKELLYTNLSEKFKCSSKDFTKQFSHIYSNRLKIMRPRLLKSAENKWGKINICSLAELVDAKGEAVITGTLYKHQSLKPSVLKEISEEHQLVPQPPATHYTSPDDVLVVEDETQRVRLVGDLPIKELATGIPIAVKGKEDDDGRFVVDDICFTGTDSVGQSLSTVAEDCYLALMSGFDLGDKNCDLLSLQMLSDWLCGMSGGRRDQEMSALVVRGILAGGLLGTYSDDSQANLHEAVKILDLFCLQISKSLPLVVMPGDMDPSNHSLPQQAFHPCVLNQATTMRSVQLASNPQYCDIGGRRILGHSGQPVDDLLRVTDGCDSLSLLRKTLEWGHLAPTAPDTLACYPFYESDPFIIDELPDVFFAGNQNQFQTELFNVPETGKKCRLVSIPKFSQTGTIVLVNLRTLDCHPFTFSH